MNDHRATLKLPPVEFDRLLAQTARGHSRHHLEHSNFLGHVNPEGDTFVDRMVKNGNDIESSGENVAYNAVLAETVFQRWMASGPDRENIERMCFVRIGVGKHGGTWTACFAR